MFFGVDLVDDFFERFGGGFFDGDDFEDVEVIFIFDGFGNFIFCEGLGGCFEFGGEIVECDLIDVDEVYGFIFVVGDGFWVVIV